MLFQLKHQGWTPSGDSCCRRDADLEQEPSVHRHRNMPALVNSLGFDATPQHVGISGGGGALSKSQTPGLPSHYHPHANAELRPGHSLMQRRESMHSHLGTWQEVAAGCPADSFPKGLQYSDSQMPSTGCVGDPGHRAARVQQQLAT